MDEGLDADATGLDVIADLTRHHGKAGRVLCGHACSLSIRPDGESDGPRCRGGLALTILPTTNLHLQDMAPAAPPPARAGSGAGIAQGRRAGSVRTDNVRDPFFPYGAHDPVDMLRLPAFPCTCAPKTGRRDYNSAARALG